LTPVPATGWHFDHWSGDLSGSDNPASIILEGSKTVTAVFLKNSVTLTVNADGSGSVTPDPASPYLYGDVVKLTPVPATGWHFDHWTGDLSGSDNPASITLEGSKTVTAVFLKDSVTLTINVTGTGTVTSNPASPYKYGDVVQLTPVPANGWVFSSWGGACSGSGACTVTMNGNQTVTANFIQKEYTVTIHIIGIGTVTVTPLKATYHLGDSIHLEAEPGLGARFEGWSGAVNYTDEYCDIVVNGDMTITATFISHNIYLPLVVR